MDQSQIRNKMIPKFSINQKPITAKKPKNPKKLTKV
jgi:hypothetical protein